MNAPLALGHRGSWPRRRRLRARFVFRHRDAHTHAIAHHLDRSLLGGVTMDFGVALVEARACGLHRCCGQLLREQAIKWRAQLIALAGVPQVKLAHEPRGGSRHALRRKLLACLGLELMKYALRMLGTDGVERA